MRVGKNVYSHNEKPSFFSTTLMWFSLVNSTTYLKMNTILSRSNSDEVVVELLHFKTVPFLRLIPFNARIYGIRKKA